MTKRLMPYGSRLNSTLIVKEGGKEKLDECLGAQMAGAALSGTGGHLTKGGWGKLSNLDQPASRLVRRNACKD